MDARLRHRYAGDANVEVAIDGGKPLEEVRELRGAGVAKA